MGVLKTMKKKCFKSFLLFLVASLLFPAAVMAAGEGHALHELKPFLVQQPKKPSAAPEFRLKDLEGRERSLSEFKGKLVLIHFWASWCEPCRLEFPALSRLSREYRDSGLVVLAIAGDSKERVKAFLKESPADFLVLLDQYGSAMRSYKVKVIPASVLIGRDGRTAGVLAGPREYDSPAAFEFFKNF